MRILFLSDLNNVHTKKWVAGFSKRGCIVCAFGLAKVEGDFYKDLKNVSVESLTFTELGDKSTFSKIQYLKVVQRLKKIYKEFKPDIVHSHYATSYGLLGSFVKHEPYLISVWGFDVYEFPNASPIHKAILKRNLRKATHLFSTSHDMAEETKKYTNKKIDVIPFGVDTQLFKPIKQEESKAYTIGIVKTLEENYGIDYLIKSFARICVKYPKKQLKLLIVGRGREEANLKKLANDLGITDKVEFAGFVDNSLIPTLLNQMNIVVIPSFIESFGVAAVEASACEIPVIASNVDGLPEVVIDGETGLLCEPGNVKSITDKIDQLIKNPKMAKLMGENGRKFVLEHYDWEKNVDNQILHYKEILS